MNAQYENGQRMSGSTFLFGPAVETMSQFASSQICHLEMLRMTLRIDQSLYGVNLRSAATKNLKLNHYPYGRQSAF